MNNKPHNKRKKSIHAKDSRSERGFTLALSVLVASLMLVVGLAVSIITIKQFTLSVSTRDSEKAFYAADAAVECTLFWDTSHPGFTQSVFGGYDLGGVTFNAPTSQNSNVTCDGVDISNPTTGWDTDSTTDLGRDWSTSSGPTTASTAFDMAFSNGTCATVVMNISDTSTTLESRGYNTCNLSSNRRVERAIRVTY